VFVKYSSWSLLVDGLACHEGQVMLLSVAGAETAIKAVNACLASNVNARFEADVRLRSSRTVESPEGEERYCPTLVRAPEGYESHKSRLGYNTWHLLALSKRDGLMPCVSATALNRQLHSPRFATPLLRSWVPWLAAKLGEARHLTLLDGFQTRAALLKAGTPELDELVSCGLRDGHLSIPEVAR
jgi:hypothetical protein